MSALSLETKDEIDICIKKIKAILTCTIFSTIFLKDGMAFDNDTLYSAFCIADDYIKNLELLIHNASEQNANPRILG
ncbi:MAG TPA: hypothetical protein VHE99_11055 [Gammaproteobacteria bacterium]|nr:hypothetical protein [Gammaproteobacteria bacterium]